MGLIKTTNNIRTFEIVQNVSGKLEGELKDWPQQMQDAVGLALERLSKKKEIPLAIVGSYCAWEADTVLANGTKGSWYVHIIASEIVKKHSLEGFTLQ